MLTKISLTINKFIRKVTIPSVRNCTTHSNPNKWHFRLIDIEYGLKQLVWSYPSCLRINHNPDKELYNKMFKLNLNLVQYFPGNCITSEMLLQTLDRYRHLLDLTDIPNWQE